MGTDFSDIFLQPFFRQFVTIPLCILSFLHSFLLKHDQSIPLLLAFVEFTLHELYEGIGTFCTEGMIDRGS